MKYILSILSILILYGTVGFFALPKTTKYRSEDGSSYTTLFLAWPIGVGIMSLDWIERKLHEWVTWNTKRQTLKNKEKAANANIRN